MLIEFVPNPDFAPQPPPIRVGSVVQTIDGYKRFITSIGVSTRNQYDLWGHGWHSRDFFTVLPERVSGWDERGPQFAPLDPPPTSFSWDDYPPKAGMVVEFRKAWPIPDGSRDQFALLLSVGKRFWAVSTILGVHINDIDADSVMTHCLRPRPDLMPRFVTEGRR